MHLLLHVGAWAVCGIAVGLHYGPLDGVAAALALYALTPWRPR